MGARLLSCLGEGFDAHMNLAAKLSSFSWGLVSLLGLGFW